MIRARSDLFTKTAEVLMSSCALWCRFTFFCTIVRWETGTGIAQFSKRYGLDEWGLISREDTGVLRRHGCVAKTRVCCEGTGVLRRYGCVAKTRVCCEDTGVLRRHGCVAKIRVCCEDTGVLRRHGCVAKTRVCCEDTGVFSHSQLIDMLWGPFGPLCSR